MSIFKKPEKGFLAKLFKHKQVEELAEELVHTYADEMQEELQSENDELTTAEDTAAEPVPMLEVTESGEVDFTEPPENVEGESPPQDTEPSEVRRHLITFRVNDMELEAINKRYTETSFKSRGDFCRYSALTVMNVEEDTEDIKQIARYISSISNSFNQVAHRVNKVGIVVGSILLAILMSIIAIVSFFTGNFNIDTSGIQQKIEATLTARSCWARFMDPSGMRVPEPVSISPALALCTHVPNVPFGYP